MSGLAKIFIVVNLVLAVFFLAASGMLLSKTDEWRTRFDEEQKAHAETRTSLQAQIDSLTAERRQLDSDLAKLKNDLNDEINLKENFQKEVNDESAANKELRNSLNALQESLSNLQQDLSSSRERISALEGEKDAAEADRTRAVDLQMAAEDELSRTKSELSDAGDRIGELEMLVAAQQDSMEEKDLMIAVAVEAGFDFSRIVAQPAIDGIIEAVDSEHGIVILSVGSDDLVKKGFLFHVYRDARYLGQVRVDMVQPDISSAVIVDGSADDIRTLDKVSTRL